MQPKSNEDNNLLAEAEQKKLCLHSALI